ncbi:MAG: RNA polymerase sigma factor [Solirubrobacterales bacterium]
MPAGSLGIEGGAGAFERIRGGAAHRDDVERRHEDADTAALVARIQAGEEDLFAKLYERYFDRVYGYLRILLRKSHEAEDGAQEVFIKAFRGLPRYKPQGRPFRAWLFTIARNHATSMLRKHRELPLESEELESRRENTGGNGASAEELRWVSDRDFLVLIERLPLAQRQVLALRYVLDLSNTEIAQIVDREPNAVRALQFRAIRTLRQRLAHRRPPPGQRRRDRMRRWPQRAAVIRARRFALLR